MYKISSIIFFITFTLTAPASVCATDGSFLSISCTPLYVSVSDSTYTKGTCSFSILSLATTLCPSTGKSCGSFVLSSFISPNPCGGGGTFCITYTCQ